MPEISLITGREEQYAGGLVVVPSYLSKGLEFDAVIIVNCEEFKNSEIDIKLLYVAMTRSLHRLCLLYNAEGELIKGLKDSFEQMQTH